MKFLDILDLDRTLNVLQRRCAANNVTLEWSEHGSVPYTTGKVISLPTPKLPVTEEEMTRVYGFVIHEAGHHSRPEAFKILHRAQPGEELGIMFNITEDDGMEREVALTHKGDAIGLGAMNKVSIGAVSDKWVGQLTENEYTKEQVAPIVMCTLGQLSRQAWDNVSDRAILKLMRDSHPSVKKYIKELVDEGYLARMMDTQNPFDTWNLACDLFKWFYPHKEEEVEKKRKQGTGELPPAKPKKAEKGKGKGKGKPAQGEEVGKGKAAKTEEKEALAEQGTVVSWKDVTLSEHDNWQPSKIDGPSGTVGIDWEGMAKGDVGVMPANMINVVDVRQDQHTPSVKYGSRPQDLKVNNKESAMFGNKIRRYLQSKERTAFTRDKEHGTIDKGSLIKMALPPIDRGAWNRKLFYTKTEKQGMDTCVLVLTDWSGSMKGAKMKYAADASGRLVHTFDRILRVPVQLAAFSNSKSKCDIGLIKSFSDHNIPPDHISKNFSKFFKWSRANNDADALLWAHREILKRKEKRKIIMVLSDGAPAGYYKGSAHSNLEAACKAVVEKGEVELYGVGIKSIAVRKYYPNHVVIQKPSEINHKLFEIIRQGDKRVR